MFQRAETRSTLAAAQDVNRQLPENFELRGPGVRVHARRGEDAGKRPDSQ